VLRDVLTRVRLLLRPYDALGRLDGEEFLLIVSRTTEDDVSAVLDRLRRAVAAVPFRLKGRTVDVTVSVGGATGREESAGELIAEARQALGEAKGAGRDTVVAGRKVLLEAVLIPE
jgi:diguanylate cyclase (GGDEF)-like protein